MSRVLPQNLSRTACGGGSRIQEEQGLKVQGSGLPSGGDADVAARNAVDPTADEDAPVEDPDADAAAARVDVAGANVAVLEQPLSRGEEVQDHRVRDLPRRGNLVDLAVDEPLLLVPALGEAAVDGDLVDEPPASLFDALGELLAVEPVLLVEQTLVSLLSHVEERDARVVLKDVLAALLGGHGTDVGHDLLRDDLGLLALVVGQLAEEALDLGDAVEVDTHELTGRLLRLRLLVGEPELLLGLFDEPRTEVGVVDDPLVESLGHAGGAQATTELGIGLDQGRRFGKYLVRVTIV